MRLEHLLQEWLHNKVMLLCKLRTYTRYREIAENHLKADIGEYEVRCITSQVIGEYLAVKRKRGNLKTGGSLSCSTVNMIRTVLKLVMQYGCDCGYVTHNPVLSVPRMKNRVKSVSAFTQQEQRRIEKAICESKDKRLIGIRISLYTGVRLGELLALRWQDIDFVSGTLYINKTVYQVKDEKKCWKTVIDRPKSDASVRYIPIPTMLLRELRAYSRERNGETVICDKHGRAVKIRTYQEIFKRLLRGNNIRELNFHALRHTFATRSLETKMDIKTLSEILGHESEAVTIKIYCHSFMSTKKKAINQLNRYYFTASNKIFDVNFLSERAQIISKNKAFDFINCS